jgi:hypothetical protein
MKSSVVILARAWRSHVDARGSSVRLSGATARGEIDTATFSTARRMGTPSGAMHRT